MSYQGWYSKNDIIKDLTTASGNVVGDFDNIVVGEQPPPRSCGDDEDDEFQILRLNGGTMPLRVQDTNDKPDLVGITKMLRMVDNFNEPPVQESNGELKDKKTNNIFVTITKLDPNSAEFVPQSFLDKDAFNKDKEKCLVISKDTHKEQNGCEANEKTDLTNNNHLDNDTSSHHEVEEELRTKIGNMSNTKCVKEKKERNIAIATLLKLHCKPASNEEKPKLMAPDYFEKSLSDHAKVVDNKYMAKHTENAFNQEPLHKIDSLTNVVNESLENKDGKRTIIENNTEKNRAQSVLSINNCTENIELNKKIEESIKKTQIVESIENRSENQELSKEMKESIKKVENWLSSPSKSKTGSSVYLGPVIFKKKNTSTPMSPISADSENSKPKPNDHFVPSSFADELTKKYMEQSKRRQIIENDIWTKLENELKVKDETIRKQRLEESRSSLNTAQSTTST